jgi:thioredoxin-related protein
MYESCPYLTGNTLCLHYRAQPVNAVWGKNRCLLRAPDGTHRYTAWAVRTAQETRYVSTTEFNRLMLFGETVAVYCKNHMEHTDTLCGQTAVRTSQETRYISATESNRLMPFGETVAVYCENRTEHTDTLCGQTAVRTSQETRYISATESNRLMLFGERVAVYCKNRTEHTDTLCG